MDLPSKATYITQLFVETTVTDRQDSVSLIHAAEFAKNRGVIVDKRKSGGYSVVYKCNSKTPCPFRVVFTKERKSTANHFTVREVNLTHGSCTGKSKPRRKDVARCSAAMSAVNNHMKIPGSSLQMQLIETIGVDLPVRTVYRNMEDIIEAKHGGVTDRYRKIRSFAQQFKQLNLSAHVAVEVLGTEFRRAFLLHPHWQRILAHSQRVIGTDGAHTKHKLHEGRMLILVAQDGNSRSIPLAATLSAPPKIETITRGSSTTSASVLKDLVYAAQSAVTKSNYESGMGILKQYHPAAHQYLRDTEFSRWCVHPNIGVRPLYGWRTSNFAESENKAALQARVLPPLHFLALYAERMISKTFARSQECARLLETGSVLTPYAQACHDVERDLMRFYCMRPVTTTEALCGMHSTRSTSRG